MRATDMGSDVQCAAERSVLQLLRDSEILAIQQQARAQLVCAPPGQTDAGLGRLDLVLAQWTASLVMDELSFLRRGNPAFTIGTDTTPRHWLGHSYPGNCKAGDNPDMIGRSAVLDGKGRYEVTGRIDPAHPPAQLVCSLFAGTMTNPASVDHKQGQAPNPDAGIFRLLSALTDDGLRIAGDGSFRLIVGGEAESGAVHMATQPLACSFGFRQMMPDWTTPPLHVSIRRLDAAVHEEPDMAMLRQKVIADLPGYLQFWGHYSQGWMGGIAPGALVGPVPREGGWGYLAASQLALEPGQAVIATLSSGGASYFAVQYTDPWMIGPAPGLQQSSLNCVQAVPDADGRTSFVISPVDPGIANWVDTGGLHQGFATMRWQGFAEARASSEGLLERFEVVSLSDIAKEDAIAPITPAERSHQLASRRASFASRYTG